MIYLELFWAFLKVGLFSFGGAYAAIPIIRDVVSTYGWVTDEMLANMIAVSESTPGPIMVNMATYVGINKGGILGAVIATVAVVLPAFVIIILITSLLKKIIDNKYTVAVLNGLKPAVIGIILAIGVFMVLENTVLTNTVSLIPIVITLILGVGWFTLKYCLKKNISPILLIVASAILGLLFYGV